MTNDQFDNLLKKADELKESIDSLTDTIKRLGVDDKITNKGALEFVAKEINAGSELLAFKVENCITLLQMIIKKFE